MSINLHAIFKGRVQGVGFRWVVSGAAELRGICGTVKNLEDESVEVYAVGSKEKLEAFVEHIKHNPGAAEIESVEVEFVETDKEYKGFQITF